MFANMLSDESLHHLNVLPLLLLLSILLGNQSPEDFTSKWKE